MITARSEWLGSVHWPWCLLEMLLLAPGLHCWPSICHTAETGVQLTADVSSRDPFMWKDKRGNWHVLYHRMFDPYGPLDPNWCVGGRHMHF